MKTISKCLLFSLLLAVALPTLATDAEKIVIMDSSKIYLDPNNLSTVIIENGYSGKRSTCHIRNWVNEDTSNGDGIIKTTTDKKGIILYSSNRYLLIDELMACKNGQVKLHESPEPENKGTLQDINFAKKLYLTLWFQGENTSAALLARWGSTENLIQAPGFSHKKGRIERGFSVDRGFGSGMISADGKYVVPNGPDCRDSVRDYNAFSVWDIETQKRVAFPVEVNKDGKVVNEEEIDDKCNRLLNGEATLEELGGTLKEAVDDKEKIVIIGNQKVYLAADDLSTVIIENTPSGKRRTCHIPDWINDSTDVRKRVIRVSTDNKTIIFYAFSRYLLVDELIACKNGQVRLYESPNPGGDAEILQDINIDKGLYLALRHIPTTKELLTAIVGHLGSDKNLISAPGFFDPDSNESDEFFANTRKQSFSIGEEYNVIPPDGKISANGRYVAPNGLDCKDVIPGDRVDYDDIEQYYHSFDIPPYAYEFDRPGVWDLEKKKRVVFPIKPDKDSRWQVVNEEAIHKKCQQLFYGKATLERLGGALRVFAADEDKVTKIDDNRIYLDPNNLSTVVFENRFSGKQRTCHIENWTNKDTDNGGGLVRATTDKKAVIFYSSNRYLLVDELRACRKGQVKLYDSPSPGRDAEMLQDMNFDKELYLALTSEDKKNWTAVIAHFNSDENLITAPGFFDKTGKKTEGRFSLYENMGQGMISPNGKYVAPNGPSCLEKYPGSDIVSGVWDIAKKKRVTFPVELSEDGQRVANENDINEKCVKLLLGKATLEELGGQLK